MAAGGKGLGTAEAAAKVNKICGPDRLAVGEILDDNRPSADTFGILVFDNSPNQHAGIQMIEWYFLAPRRCPCRRSIVERGDHMVAAAVILQQDNAVARPVAT